MPKIMPEFEEVVKLQWPIIFAVDTSASMAGRRLFQLNAALQELTCMLENLADQMEVQLSIRLIEFNTEARWLVGGLESGVDHLDIFFSEASGGTNTADALKLVKDVMTHRNLSSSCPSRYLKPVVILITDGYSINPQETAEVIEELKKSPMGRKMVRVAFIIGDEMISEVEKFASLADEKPLIFKVDDLGHIPEINYFRNISFSRCFVHDHISPYDDFEQIPFDDESEWEDTWEE